MTVIQYTQSKRFFTSPVFFTFILAFHVCNIDLFFKKHVNSAM